MKHIATVSILTLITLILQASAQQSQTRGLSFSGIFESSISTNINTNDDNGRRLSYGLEEYANIRMQARIGENAAFFGAVNLIAAAGDYALAAAATGADFADGNNYAATIELERLHFRIKGENVDFNAGLLRKPFGYGQVWRPSDFLNPPNPLRPDARPRAVLAGGAAWHPVEDLKLLGFVASGRDPFAQDNGLVGISADKHLSRGSAQLLYALEYSDQFPGNAGNMLTHRAGMSVKADLILGFVIDAIYAYNQGIDDKIDGLSFSAGFDYSLLDAKLIILAEYLFNGASSSTSISGGGGFANENYLYTGATWRFSDFTSAGLAVITGLDDASFIPLITFNHEISQGVSMSLMAQIPMDRNLLTGDGNRGELGPIPPGLDAGSHFYFEGKIRLRF
ncbi:MAG: hypothetical protein LBU70_11085 [Chitinispirillales bacterium]|jgi:hypothetical protein|nr:hypothetical protein [Chitinispirillales bacterium]